MDKLMVSNIKSMLIDPYALDVMSEALLRMPQVDIPVKHLLLPGMYSREIFMPKGTLLIGCSHPEDFMEIMVSGKVLMFSDDSETIIEGPFSRVAKSGKRKCGYVLEDTVWITYHPVKATTIEEAEAETMDMTNHYIEDSKADFKAMLIEDKITEEFIQEQMDLVPVMGIDSDIFEMDESPINGMGLFVKQFMSKNDLIGFALFNGNKTTLGRYINHSHSPNSRIVTKTDGNVEIRTNRSLFIGEEITINYRKREI